MGGDKKVRERKKKDEKKRSFKKRIKFKKNRVEKGLLRRVVAHWFFGGVFFLWGNIFTIKCIILHVLKKINFSLQTKLMAPDPSRGFLDFNIGTVNPSP